MNEARVTNKHAYEQMIEGTKERTPSHDLLKLLYVYSICNISVHLGLLQHIIIHKFIISKILMTESLN